jgi:hypothetical protein
VAGSIGQTRVTASRAKMVEIEAGGVVVAASSSGIGSKPKLQDLSVDKTHHAVIAIQLSTHPAQKSAVTFIGETQNQGR